LDRTETDATTKRAELVRVEQLSGLVRGGLGSI
jgi:hypothetical protein